MSPFCPYMCPFMSFYLPFYVRIRTAANGHLSSRLPRCAPQSPCRSPHVCVGVWVWVCACISVCVCTHVCVCMYHLTLPLLHPSYEWMTHICALVVSLSLSRAVGTLMSLTLSPFITLAVEYIEKTFPTGIYVDRGKSILRYVDIYREMKYVEI